MLELVSYTPDGHLYLTGKLPYYEPEAHDPRPETQNSRESLLRDAPFSEEEFGSAWSDLSCFEQGDQAYIPTALTLLQTWKSILSTTTIRGIDLQTPVSIEDLLATIDDGDHPPTLYRSILQKLCKSDTELDKPGHGKIIVIWLAITG